MSAWLFVAGCVAGSLWTLLIARFSRSFRLPTLRAKYVAVTVTDTGPNKIYAIKQIRAATGFGLKEAKEAAEGATFTVQREDADKLLRDLRASSIAADTRVVRKASA